MNPNPVYDLSKSASRLRLALDQPTPQARRSVVAMIKRYYDRNAALELEADLRAMEAAGG